MYTTLLIPEILVTVAEVSNVSRESSKAEFDLILKKTIVLLKRIIILQHVDNLT
jgi:hypothetical protein